MKNLFFLIFSLLLLSGCYKVSEKLEPKISYTVQEQYINSLASAFTPLTSEEKEKDWGKEYSIALAFAKEVDLYRAISTFKRAEILLPKEQFSRKPELQYHILLCYFLGKKYEDLTQFFEKSTLSQADKSFPAFHDLLLILYESYKEMGEEEKRDRLFDLLQENYPGTGSKLLLSDALLNADIAKVEKIAEEAPPRPYLTQMLSDYAQEKKSVPRAQILNALLPGAGYWYVGQKKTAITAFLTNGLFLAAAYQFFHKGYLAAGIITSSFEMGWYFGGIYGAGESTKFYNECIYEKHASTMMNQNGLFPIFMLQFTF